MKIIIRDFNYEGKHHDEVVFELTHVSNIEDIPEGKIVPYVMEGLNNLLED